MTNPMTDDNARARELAQQFGFQPHVFSDEKTEVLKDIAYAKACDNLAAALTAARVEGLRTAAVIAAKQSWGSDVVKAVQEIENEIARIASLTPPKGET